MAADLEHLKLIQAVISRMAANCFVLKGWAVTLVTGLAALAKANENDDIAWISLGVLVVFAYLDGYYLSLERAYRDFYADTVQEKTVEYSLALTAPPGRGDVFKAMWSRAHRAALRRGGDRRGARRPRRHLERVDDLARHDGVVLVAEHRREPDGESGPSADAAARAPRRRAP